MISWARVKELATDLPTVVGSFALLVAGLTAIGITWNSPFAWASDVNDLKSTIQKLQVQGDETSIETLKTRRTVLEGLLFDVEVELEKNQASRTLKLRKKELEAEIAQIDREIEAKGKKQ